MAKLAQMREREFGGHGVVEDQVADPAVRAWPEMATTGSGLRKSAWVFSSRNPSTARSIIRRGYSRISSGSQ